MQADDPLLVMLGRRGRSAVVRALRRGGSQNLRRLAQEAGVHPVVAGRAVRELAALGAVEVLRPGRDLAVRWRPETVAGRFLGALEMPDLRGAAADTFAQNYLQPGVDLVQWARPEDTGDPLAPVRLALVARDEEAALDAAGPALDAVEAAGLPAPDVMALPRRGLTEDDPVAAAVRAGRRLR